MTLQRLDGKIRAARLALAFEALWAALLWPMVLASVALAALFSGLLPSLQAALRLAVLASLALAFLASLGPLLRLRLPSQIDAMRRIERYSGLPHRPVSGLSDRLADGDDDPQRMAIWLEHKRRQLAGLVGLRAGLPQSRWRDLDAAALRLPAILLLVASLVLGRGSPSESLAAAVAQAPPASETLALDAWLKPPAYTGKPPVMLTSPAMTEKLKDGEPLLIPQNAVLALRLTGAADAKIAFESLSPSGGGGAEVKDLKPSLRRDKNLFQAEVTLTRPVYIRVSDGSRELAHWPVALIPDAAPKIAFAAEPAGDSAGTLTAKWKASDDYGVTDISAELSLADNQDDGVGFAGNGIFLYQPPKFPISLRRAAAKEEAGATTADLAEHPWAGFMVEMQLKATDAAGQTGRSETRTFRMPERLFIKPLARALIEQRKHLILQPDRSGEVEQMLEALIAWPDGLTEGSGAVISIAAIASRLRAAAGQDDIDAAVAMLWQTAVGIEDGSMAEARANLEAIRKELERALAEGASPERIAELMDKMRQAMDRYMQSLMNQTDKRMRQGQQQDQRQLPGRMVTPEDLKKMLDTIQKLAESGANDAARQMLSQLDDILRNLKPGQQQGQMQSQQGQQLGKMLDQLSELLRRQQQLMDDTQRLPPDGAPGQNGGEQNNPGMQISPDALAGQQKGLEDRLAELLRRLGENGLNAPDSLGQAGRSMKEAEGSLRRSDREGALGRQGDAMVKLRQGAQGMARQLLQQGFGQQGNYGRNGEARGDDRDPLGRPTATRNEDTGPLRNMLPTEMAIRRAREILDILRSRANEADRPRLELDYIDRLLRGLY
ncbi:MAG: TIGR02302 family protein [Rhizobiales bacterium]|nr:TIGR02302 family protein [Hyphomicrobiales bacterium]MBI3673162.1 TIGR02302 family protein [Hyphomicrobiales bacterium]